VNDDGVEVVGQAPGRRAEAAFLELVDERVQPLLGVAVVDRVVQRLPIGLADAVALGLGGAWPASCALGARRSAGDRRQASTARSP
jgi:hypothetical protein